MDGKSKPTVEGPLSEEALEKFTKYLSLLCDQMMVLDPESHGHKVFSEHIARYQWKVQGGNSGDHKGVAVTLGMNNEVYFIVKNQIRGIFRIDPEKRNVNETLLNNVEDILPPQYGPVLADMMAP